MAHQQRAPNHEQPRATCPAVTRSGTPCRGAPLGAGWCFAHDPALADARAAGRAQGGRNRATAARAFAGLPDPVAEILDGLRDTFAATRAGEIAPARAQALAAVGRAILSAWDLAVVEDRLDDIEAHVAALDARRQLRSIP